MLIKNIIKEFKVWRTVKQVIKHNKNSFYALGFDYDWLGRLYTIVNIPDEIMSIPLKTRKDYVMQNMMIDNYIKESLSDVSDLLTELRLSDLIIYPNTFERFENTDSILVVLAPERRYTKWWKLLLYSIVTAGIGIGVFFLIEYLIKTI